MMRRRKLATLGTALLVAAALPLGSQVNAADHADAPATAGDSFADLNDLYAWHTGNDTLVVILTFNGLHAPGDPETDYLDPAETPNVLHSIHIDNTADPILAGDPTTAADNDNESDIDIHVRLGQNGLGEWGYQVEGIPGVDPIVGPLGEVTSSGGAQATVGLFDDPFFFDLTAFNQTLTNLHETKEDGDLAFPTADTFAGTNTMAVAIEIPIADALGGDNPENFLQIWATSGRAPK